MSNLSYLFCKKCNRKSPANPNAECWDYSECGKCFYRYALREPIYDSDCDVFIVPHSGIINEFLDSGMRGQLREFEKNEV